MNIIILVVLVLFSSLCHGKEVAVDDKVALSVGRMQVYQNLVTRYEEGNIGLGHYYLAEMLRQEYEKNIAGLKVNDRIQFIWGVISFAKFGSHGTEEMTEIIHECCQVEFLKSANSFIEKASSMPSASYIDESLVKKAKFFIGALEVLASAKR